MCRPTFFSAGCLRRTWPTPIARLTPLGWTCVGPVAGQKDYSTNFARTYFTTEETDVSKIYAVLQKFWEVHSCAIKGSLITWILEYTVLETQFS